MNEIEAQSEIELLTDAASAPVLDAEAVALLVQRAKRADAAGRAPADPAWEPTWDLAAAAALGWQMKAGKCAGAYDFQADGQTFNRAQMHAHFRQMAAEYRRRIGQSVPVAGALARGESYE